MGTIALGMTAPSFDFSLGDQDSTEITVSSVDGYAGAVELSLDGVPAEWNVTVEPATLTLAAGGTASAVLTLQIPTDASADEVTVSVVATPLAESRDLSLTASTTVSVESALYSAVGAGTGNGEHDWPDVTITLGSTVIFSSDDQTANHQIHANFDDQGFSHQGSPFGMGT